MKNMVMTVSYDGTGYHGFQIQPNIITVQQVIQQAIERLVGESITINASGRTDAGVHANGQVIQFHTASSIPVQNWVMALNTFLPEDIIVTDAWEAPTDFHARKSASEKTYRFSILNRPNGDVFLRKYALHYRKKLNWSAMAVALSHFIGTYRFTSFCSPKTQTVNHVRTIFDASITQDRSVEDLYHIWLKGNGFLYKMVRIIVGTLLQVGTGKRDAVSVPELIRAEDRSLTGPAAPACGLCLWEVKYERNC